MSIAAIAERRTQVRYLIIGLIFIVTSINYADRATFSIAGSDAARELGLSKDEQQSLAAAGAFGA